MPVSAPLTVRDRAVIAAGACLAFDALAWLVGVGDCTGALASRYETLLCPASWGEAIWIAIHVGFLAYAIAARHPSQRAVGTHDDLARLVIAASILRPAWTIALRVDAPAGAVLAAIALLVVAIMLYVRARDLCRRERATHAWVVPFSVFLPWMMTTAVATVAVWLVSIGWRDAAIGETTWTVAALVATTVIAVAVGVRFADPIVPLVVAWSTLAIWSAHDGTTTIDVALVALVTAGTSIVGALVALVRVAAATSSDHPPAVVRRA